MNAIPEHPGAESARLSKPRRPSQHPHAYPLCQSELACCHCEERSDVAISLRLSTRRRTIIATAPRLPPPYQVRGCNDRLKLVRMSPDTRLAQTGYNVTVRFP